MNNIMKLVNNLKPKICHFIWPDSIKLLDVDNIFVINLSKESAKRNYIIKLFKKKKINFTLVIVEPITIEIYNMFVKNNEITKSEFGCLISHLFVLKTIVKSSKNSLVFEDDIWLHKQFVENWNNIIYKQKYDFLLLGACDFHFSKENYKFVNNNMYRMKHENQMVYGAHANFYSPRAAKFWLKYKINSIEFFDKNYFSILTHFPLTSGIIYPNLVLTDISYSNNGHTFPFLSQKENDYYSTCFKSVDFKNYHVFYPILFKNTEITDIISRFQHYEELIDYMLYIYFRDSVKETKIKDRLDLDHLTLEDVQYIIYNKI